MIFSYNPVGGGGGAGLAGLARPAGVEPTGLEPAGVEPAGLEGSGVPVSGPTGAGLPEFSNVAPQNGHLFLPDISLCETVLRHFMQIHPMDMPPTTFLSFSSGIVVFVFSPLM